MQEEMEMLSLINNNLIDACKDQTDQLKMIEANTYTIKNIIVFFFVLWVIQTVATIGIITFSALGIGTNLFSLF